MSVVSETLIGLCFMNCGSSLGKDVRAICRFVQVRKRHFVSGSREARGSCYRPWLLNTIRGNTGFCWYSVYVDRTRGKPFLQTESDILRNRHRSASRESYNSCCSRDMSPTSLYKKSVLWTLVSIVNAYEMTQAVSAENTLSATGGDGLVV